MVDDGAAPGVLRDEGGEKEQGVGDEQRDEGEPGLSEDQEAQGGRRGDGVEAEDGAAGKALPF